jgi:hypothetical protein
MAIGTVNRPGEINTAGAFEALFIPVAAEQVLLSYQSKVVLDSKIMMKSAPAGAESVQFDMIGDASTIRRELGKSIYEDTTATANKTPSRSAGGANPFTESINHGRRKVFLDRPLLGGPVFIDDFEGFLSTLADGGQAPILSKIGKALAIDSDLFGMILAMKGAAPATKTGYINWAAAGVEIPTEFKPGTPGDNWVVDANALTDGSALLDGIRVMTEYWDDNNVPDESRFVFLKPAQYNLLVQNQDLLNRDFGNQNGVFSDGTVFRAWGAELVKTSLPFTDNYSGLTTLTGVRNPEGYNLDATNVAALGIQSEAMGKARSGGMKLMVDDKSVEYGGHAMLGEMTFGFDIFRPIGLGAVATSAS